LLISAEIQLKSDIGMDKHSLIRSSALFAELDDRELTALLDVVSVREVPKDTVLFLEGDPAVGFYALITGGVRIYKAAPDGRELTLHSVRPGHLFAEAAVFRGRGYPANAMSTENSVVAFFPKSEVLSLLGQYPQIALKLIGSMAAWLREFARKLEDFSLKEVPARLADYLLAEAARQQSSTIKLPMTKTDLSSHLGTIIETLSRNFRRFREAGLISVDGPRIEILDANGLKAVSRGEKVPGS
jgi:CRP/FNR family transcriptional regulator